jgi:signal transduction histidine kinase/DNA-binding response OmpR family regulator
VEENTKEILPGNANSGVFSQIQPSFYSVSEDSVSGKLWFGCEGGLYYYDYNKRRIYTPVILTNLRNSYGSRVFSVQVDDKSNVIFGSSRGLFVYNAESQLVSNYFESGVFENTIFHTLFIDNNILWAATSEGLMKITGHNSTNDVVYYQVGNHEFRESSFCKTQDDFVYLGTNSGFFRFQPQLIKENISPNRAIITSFDRINTRSNSDVKQLVAIDVIDSVATKLPFSYSVYQFNFNSFDLPFQDKISYSYSLEGFEEIWHTGKLRTATYTNLAPGEYTFLVKASTKHGMWSHETTKLKFKVLPAWWQTVVFKIAVLLFVFVVIALFWFESLKRVKLRHLVNVEKTEQKRLKDVNRMKLQFFTNISHELRTPLTLIYNPLRKMVDQNTSVEQIKNDLPGLFRNAKRMKDLVDQILEFRKAEMDELHLKLGNFDFIDFCREVIDSFHFMAETEGIQIRFKHKQEQLFFDFDRDKFTKIMYNLLSNALKFTPKKGIIVIKVKKEKEFVRISVSDRGKGIPESKLTAIFERYFQIENNGEGTGIGLALTKKLVQMHDGQIWAESTLGQGSVFKIQIPFKSELPVGETQKGSSFKELISKDQQKELIKDKKQTDSNLSVLIVEDDWELKHYLEEELSSNYTVFTASNGKEGLAEAIDKVPDVIISDVMMPELNGFEFCKALRADLRISHIPVILLTAKTLPVNEIEGYKSGADLYILKPFDNEVLSSQMESLLNNRELLRKRFSHDLNFKVEEITHSEIDEKFLHKAISVVEMNLQNVQFDVNVFVEQLGTSRTLAYKKIKTISGKSINDFILSVRLQKAANMLKQGDKTISVIAMEIGFSDHSYFSAVFKKNFGVSPSEYRQIK